MERMTTTTAAAAQAAASRQAPVGRSQRPLQPKQRLHSPAVSGATAAAAAAAAAGTATSRKPRPRARQRLTPLTMLPPELWQRIVAYLDYRDLVRFAATSRLAFGAAEERFRLLCLSQHLNAA